MLDWPRLDRSSEATLAAYPSPDLADSALQTSCLSRDSKRVEKFAAVAMKLYGEAPHAFDASAYCGWRNNAISNRDVIEPQNLPRGDEMRKASERSQP